MAKPASRSSARTVTLRKSPLVLSLAMVMAAPGSLPGQVFGFHDDPGKDTWKSVLTPYLWMVNQTGTRTLGPLETPIDITFGDIWSNLKFGGSLHYVGRKGDWGVVLDAGYLHTEESGIPIREFLRADTLSASYSNKTFQGEAAATYEPWDLPNQFLDLLAGIRVTSQSTNLMISLQTPPLSSARDFSSTWVDPIIGARWGVGFGREKRWQAGARADIGGFGVGSQFAFNGEAGIGYRIIKLLSLDVLFRYLYMNYESGTVGTLDYYQQKTDQLGILVGVGFWF